MSEKIFDCIVIGSSPLMLIEALYQSELKKSVLIIESKDFIGGSWHCFNKKYFADNIEIGCHIWQKNDRVISFLKETFDIKIITRTPQPKAIFFNIKLPYPFINLLLIFRKINFRSLYKLNHLRLYKSLFFDFLKQGFSTSKYYYPKGGSKEFTSKIFARINESSVLLIKGTTITSINLSSNTVQCDNDRVYKFNEIIATNKLDVDQITLPNMEVLKLQKRVSIIYNLYLIVDKKINLSYAETYGDNVVYRLADMTYKEPMLINKSLSLLCVDIFPTTYHKFSKNKLKELVVIRLIKWNIIDEKINIVNHFFNSYTYNGQSNEIISVFNKKTNSKINFLKSNNLIPSLSENLIRWEKLMK